jgi:hypothetical protein
MLKSALFVFFIFLFAVSLPAQERILRYDILHNGEIKGALSLYQNTVGNTTHIKIESLVKTRFIIRINVESIEEAIFQDGILIFSSLHRIINGNESVNQQIQAKGPNYKMTGGTVIKNLPDYPIYYSILSLYYQEPTHINRVYSDNFNQYVQVSRVAANKYKISFPNGNYNYYTYKNGICTTVDINQTFYSIQFRLNPFP